MKGAKFLVSAIVAALMLVGAGYAYWTDSLTVNNTVSTGELNVDFTPVKLLGVIPVLPRAIGFDGISSGYLKAEAKQIDTKTNEVTITNMYPGSLGLYAAKIENTGSIPAVFDGADVSFDNAKTDDTLKNHLITLGGYMHFDKDDNYLDGNWFYSPSLNELDSTLDTFMHGLRLEPGDYILLDVPDEYKDEIIARAPEYAGTSDNCIIFYLPGKDNPLFNIQGVVNDDNVETAQAKFDITFNWKQHNDID